MSADKRQQIKLQKCQRYVFKTMSTIHFLVANVTKTNFREFKLSNINIGLKSPLHAVLMVISVFL